MTTTDLILIALGVIVVLPTVAYMVMKFGTAGFLRAKQRQKEKENKPNE